MPAMLSRVGLRVLSGMMLLVGACFAAGGVWLAKLGGSLYYVLAGGACLIAGVLLWRRRKSGLWIYLATLFTTTVWALLEVGLDFWQLVPRLDLFVALVLPLSLPALRRQLRPVVDREQGTSAGEARAVRGSALALFAVLSIVAVVLGAGLMRSGAASASKPVGPMTPMPAGASESTGTDWRANGGDIAGTRFSSAAQITAANVDQLQVAWTYRTGDLPGASSYYTFETTPIKVDDTLYLCTPRNIVVALDADSGAEKWRFDPKLDEKGVVMLVCRGVAYHAAAADVRDCPRRLLMGTLDGRLIAINADTGERCAGFGSNGEVSLRENLGNVMAGTQYITSPPAIAGNAVIVGGAVLDGMSVNMPSGVVRAFDAITGRPLWAWDAGRSETTPLMPGESYPRGSPNAWSLFSVDAELGLVYIPTGNATPDFYGAQRPEAYGRYSSSVVALDVASGAVRWSFQTVHHDLWDYDVGAQPVLMDLSVGDAKVPAVIQATKHGDIYVLDRRDGTPVVPVEERAAPRGDLQEEPYSPTQPASVGLPEFTPRTLMESDMWGATALDQMWCRIDFRSRRYDGKFTLPSLEPTLQYPGNFGVVDWGSVAVDQARQIMIVNSSYLPLRVRLVPRAEADAMKVGKDGHGGVAAQAGTPYAVEFGAFLSPLGLPCHAPPWGKLSAVDLRTRQLLWQRPLGTTRDHAPLGLAVPGVFNIGGSVITRGGVVFIAATIDNYLRAFDLTSGKELWKGRLPAGGQATPMTYVSGRTGKQYVVIAAGGHQFMQTTLGDHIVAYSLPEDRR
jgi:quinoprotein glucose dehydrogenase/quinate dehydrogenase (quinone)